MATLLKQRRASPRLCPKPGSHIVYLEGFGMIQDVSLHGVFVVDPKPLPVGTKIKFSLRFGSMDIPVQGTVQRSVDGEGMGIALTDLTAEARNRLKLYLHELMTDTRTPLTKEKVSVPAALLSQSRERGFRGIGRASDIRATV
jgi:hypothetical protein